MNLICDITIPDCVLSLTVIGTLSIEKMYLKIYIENIKIYFDRRLFTYLWNWEDW